MEEIDSSPPASNPRKRAAPDDTSPQKKALNLKGTQFMMPTPPDTDQSSNASPSYANPSYANNNTVRQDSPALSTSTMTSVEIVSANGDQENSTTESGPTSTTKTTNTSNPRPAKRRKLTQAEKAQKEQEKVQKEQEKAQKQKEKEAKDAEKAELKAKRDEEKRIKDEEKRKKAEEREAKKREKDLEEERKAQEKLKKERAQMRLGAWFQKPSTPAKQAEDGEGQMTNTRRKSLSLEPFDAVADRIRGSASPFKGEPQATVEKTPAKESVSDYKKFFLPFQLQSHSWMPSQPTSDDMQLAQEAFDHDTNDASLREKYDLGLVDAYAGLEQQFADARHSTRGQPLPVTRNLFDQIQGSIQQPIDLTNENSQANPMDALQDISRRYLEFHEDVRPPYFGTYSKVRSPRTSKKLCRNPFARGRKDTDYDYDSEAEWEEPEEGEDIDLEDEDDEAESVGEANEMDEFLDDEDDAIKTKRKLISGDLVPECTGLCWEDTTGKTLSSTKGQTPSQAMREMRIGVLLPGFSGATIDPFSAEYWQTEPTSAPKAVPSTETSATQAAGLMPPPRAPLQQRTNTNATLDQMLVGAAEGMKGPINSIAPAQESKAGRKAVPKTLSKEDLDEFKDAVVGSQLSKADLLKGLKARFPKITNDTIKSTLGEHFAQVGANKADKKWVYVSAT